MMPTTNTTNATMPATYHVITTRNATHAEEKRQQTPAEIYEEAQKVLIPDLFKIVLSYYYSDIKNVLNDEDKNILNMRNSSIYIIGIPRVFITDYINKFIYRYITDEKRERCRLDYNLDLYDITATPEDVKNGYIARYFCNHWTYNDKKTYQQNIDMNLDRNYKKDNITRIRVKQERQFNINYIQYIIENQKRLRIDAIRYLRIWGDNSYIYNKMYKYKEELSEEIKKVIPKTEDIIYKDIVYNEDIKEINNNAYGFLNCYYKDNYIYGRKYKKTTRHPAPFKKIKKMTISTTRTKPDINNVYLNITTYIKINNNVYDYAKLYNKSYNQLYLETINHKDDKKTLYKGFIQDEQDNDIYNKIYKRLYDKVISQIQDNISIKHLIDDTSDDDDDIKDDESTDSDSDYGDLKYEGYTDDESTDDEDTISESTDSESDDSYYSEGENEDGCPTCRKFCNCSL